MARSRQMNGKCTANPCPKGRYHGPETPAMQKKRLADEIKMKQRAAAGGNGTQSEIESGGEGKAAAKGAGKGRVAMADMPFPLLGGGRIFWGWHNSYITLTGACGNK